MGTIKKFCAFVGGLIAFLGSLLFFSNQLSKFVNETEVSGVLAVHVREWVTANLHRERGERVTQRLSGLEVTLGDSRVKLESRIDMFFRSTRTGSLSLWNRDSSGVVRRIYPASSRTLPVGADETWARRLLATGSPGPEHLYVVWTPTMSVHAFGEQYPNRNAFLNGLQDGTGRSFREVLIQFELEIL